MKAVISVAGKDSKGIVAAVAEKCTEFNTNIVDISQTVMSEYFAMIILVELLDMNATLSDFADALEKLGNEKQLVIKVCMRHLQFDARI